MDDHNIEGSSGTSDLSNVPVPSSNLTGNYETKLLEALVNEGKHERVLNQRRPTFNYDEKTLREAAAAEVAQTNNRNGVFIGDGDESVGIDIGVETNNNKINNNLNAGEKPRKRRNLSADEKAKQSRDRNREHARNTRLRKKAYVSKLEELVDQLTNIKDVESRERLVLGKCIHDTHDLRKTAVSLFLNNRAANVTQREKWANFVDENFVMTLPITPFRWFLKSDIVNNSRVIVGIDALIRDNASQHLMVRDFGYGTDSWKESVINHQIPLLMYDIETNDLVAASNLVMGCYKLILDGSDIIGNNCQCTQSGMVQVKFNEQNKIVAVELIYDVMGFMQQLQHTSLVSPENSIVPNTLSMAVQPSSIPRMIIKSTNPFEIVHINQAWTRLKGVTQGMINMYNNLSISDALLAYPISELHQSKISKLKSSPMTTTATTSSSSPSVSSTSSISQVPFATIENDNNDNDNNSGNNIDSTNSSTNTSSSSMVLDSNIDGTGDIISATTVQSSAKDKGISIDDYLHQLVDEACNLKRLPTVQLIRSFQDSSQNLNNEPIMNYLTIIPLCDDQGFSHALLTITDL